MNKLILLTTFISFLYFGFMRYFTTHEVDVAEFVIMAFVTMIYGAFLIVSMLVADDIAKAEEK
jgi:hypothetical protein